MPPYIERMNDMAGKSIFSYELIDNKIPCGGFNLLGGGVKGRNIESKELQSLFGSVYQDLRGDKTVVPQRLLVLNYEDSVKIDLILQNPPSEQKVVVSNLRFTCWNYYDYLQFANRYAKVQSYEEYESMHNGATNGNIVTLYDIANLYTKELGIKTVPRVDEENDMDILVNNILTQYYQLKSISFDKWIYKATVWTYPDQHFFVEIAQRLTAGADMFNGFRLDFITEGNILTYMPGK